MEITELKWVEKKIVKDILCNKCGESCKSYVDSNHELWNFNSAIITPDFEYGSIYDMADWEVHICENCYTEFESTFKIKPKNILNVLST